MKNLEKIKKAWAMGWSAKVVHVEQGSNGVVVGYEPHWNAPNSPRVQIRWDSGVINQYGEETDDGLKITGYKYAGELAGNEEIPYGQKFRFKVKKEDVIDAECCGQNGNDIDLKLKFKDGSGGDYKQYYHKSEIEPVFE